MNHSRRLRLPSVSKVSLALILMLVSASPVAGLALQWNHPLTAPTTPSYRSPALQVNPQPAIQNLPPGATTTVLPDGRIAIITPFSKEKILSLIHI